MAPTLQTAELELRCRLEEMLVFGPFSVGVERRTREMHFIIQNQSELNNISFIGTCIQCRNQKGMVVGKRFAYLQRQKRKCTIQTSVASYCV